MLQDVTALITISNVFRPKINWGKIFIMTSFLENNMSVIENGIAITIGAGWCIEF